MDSRKPRRGDGPAGFSVGSHVVAKHSILKGYVKSDLTNIDTVTMSNCTVEITATLSADNIIRLGVSEGGTFYTS